MYPKPYKSPLTRPLGGTDAPVATGGTVQPRSPHGPKLPKPKKVVVKKHTRTIQPKPPAPPTDQALINAAVRARFGPVEQGYTDQLNQNARFTSGLGDWYSNAQKEIQGLKAQGQQQSAQTLQSIQSYNAQPALQNPADVQAANARNSLNSEYGAMVGRDENANSASMDRLAAAFLAQQGNTQNQANADRSRILQGQASLQGQKADYGLTYGSQLQTAEQKAQMDQANLAVKQGTLAYLTGNAQSEAQNRVAGQRVARTNARTQRVNAKSRRLDVANQAMQDDRKFQLDQAKFGAAQAKDNYQRAHGLGPYKPAGTSSSGSRYTKTQLGHYDNQWNGALALAGHLKAAKTYNAGTKAKPVMKTVTHSDVYSALLKKYPDDPEFAKAAADLAFGQSVSKHDLHVLATKGVHPVTPLQNTVIAGTHKVVKALKP